jgi:hypothetical protein
MSLTFMFSVLFGRRHPPRQRCGVGSVGTLDWQEKRLRIAKLRIAKLP